MTMLKTSCTGPGPLAAACAIACFVACDSFAQSAVTADFGQETRGGINRSALGVSFPTGWQGRLNGTAWSARVDVDVARWHSHSQDEGRANLWDLGVTPQLRIKPPPGERLGLFLDLGVGGHLLSAHDVGKRRLGSTFQFGEHLGIGVAFGDHGEYAAALRVLHVSNAGINHCNDGLTSIGLRFEYVLP